MGRWRAWVPLLLVAALAGVAAGCGEEGAEQGAELTVYVSAPLRGDEGAAGRRLCEEARERARRAGPAGGYRLRVVCLDASGGDGHWTLAKVGSNARRATEDSTAVAYVGEPDLGARRHSRPILEAAEIAEIGGAGGREAVRRIAAALAEGETSDPRARVFNALEA